jgi:hypothetical protein
MPKVKRIAGLAHCNYCHENSVVRQIHYDKGYRLDFCKNKGCGYKATTPYPLTIVNADGIRQVNIEHKPIPKWCNGGMDREETAQHCADYEQKECWIVNGLCPRKDEYDCRTQEEAF